jgi:hypothetical protein
MFRLCWYIALQVCSRFAESTVLSGMNPSQQGLQCVDDDRGESTLYT